MKPKLCLALDADLEKVEKLLIALKGYPLIYKIGYKLFLPYGPSVVNKVKELAEAKEIFLDLKLHDIPNTVRNGVEAVSKMGIQYLTLHALGGPEMLKAAAEVKGQSKLLGVTLLTSHGEEFLKLLETQLSQKELVLRLATLAVESGCDGVVCSAHEVGFLKREIKKPFIAVVPGIRLKRTVNDDQKRVASPEEALENGADILVIGRPVLNAENPVKFIEELLKLLGY